MTLEYIGSWQENILSIKYGRFLNGKIEKKLVGLNTSKYIGIPSIYNFRCNPDCIIGKMVCRRIYCACLIFVEIQKVPWNILLDYEK